MKVKGIKIEKPKELQTIIYECPYCSKKLINKNSYYNHIAKGYCWNFNIDFQQKTNEYEEGKITIDEYYEWCYEKGWIEYLNLDEKIISKLSDNLYNKISSMYSDDDYY